MYLCTFFSKTLVIIEFLQVHIEKKLCTFCVPFE